MSSTILYEKEITLNAIDSAYQKGKKEGTIEELENLKTSLNLKIEYLINIAKADYINGIEETINILDKRISELKENKNESE